jgi:hypothetical protein
LSAKDEGVMCTAFNPHIHSYYYYYVFMIRREIVSSGVEKGTILGIRGAMAR